MQDTVFYLQLYYLYDVWSRLTSPEIYIPEVAADEAVRLDWLMGATTYGSTGGSRLDTSTVVRMEVRNLDDAEITVCRQLLRILLDRIPEVLLLYLCHNNQINLHISCLSRYRKGREPRALRIFGASSASCLHPYKSLTSVRLRP